MLIIGGGGGSIRRWSFQFILCSCFFSVLSFWKCLELNGRKKSPTSLLVELQ